jgi:LysR family glycine cleavage system transcriptional activator
MPRRLPQLNALKAFEAAARYVSFTRAAEELCVTQGAVSHQVKALESELGVKLFNRDRQRLTITDAGREYLAATASLPKLVAFRDWLLAQASEDIRQLEIMSEPAGREPLRQRRNTGSRGRVAGSTRAKAQR